MGHSEIDFRQLGRKQSEEVIWKSKCCMLVPLITRCYYGHLVNKLFLFFLHRFSKGIIAL